MSIFKERIIGITWDEYYKWTAAANVDLLQRLMITETKLYFRYKTRNPNRFYKNSFGFEIAYNHEYFPHINDMCVPGYIRVYNEKKVFMFRMKHGLL